MQPPRFLPALLLLAACGGTPGRIAPAGLAPVTAEQVREWSMATQPEGNQELRFRFVFTDRRSAAAKGRGSASIAGRDSLRFDFSGPLGQGRGAAVVVGDSAIWAQPEEQVEKLVPSYPLLWAMLGRALPPSGGSDFRGLSDGRVTAWRYIVDGDTVDYVRSKGGTMELRAEVRQGGRRLGVVTTTFDAAGNPVKSRLDIPSGPARLDLNFTSVKALPRFAADVWEAPRDSL